MFKRIGLAFRLLIILIFLQRSTVLTSDLWNAISVQITPIRFDYVGWELQAIAAKAGQTLFGAHPFMNEIDRIQYVRDYMVDLQRAQILEEEISRIYTNPDIEDPEVASTELRLERDALRDSLASRQLLAEAILEGQVAAVLIEQGFGVGGQLLPPMAMHFTEVPNLLIVSPRDAIQFDISLNLYGLPVDEQVALEDVLDTQYDISTLIVPLGGIALYPAMIIETSSIHRAVEVFAHEWLHHYLYFFPLGIDYITGGEGFASEARIINETTADLFGREVALLVLERYYPDLVPPPQSEQTPQQTSEPDPNRFDFGATMNETRVTVDELLTEGLVEEAEAYMERQRQLFVQNGYLIRKINQAYFAFYGGYQGGGQPGAGGGDPIGPAVKKIREVSESLYDFAIHLRGITTREQLLELRNRLFME